MTSYVAAQLRDGRLVVVVDLGDGEQLFPVINTPRLDDGSSHLVNVIRDRLQLRVKINGTVQLDDQLTSFRPLQAQILYLGGLPPSARNRRQTTSSSPSLATSLEGRNFKGIIQDIQVRIQIKKETPLTTNSNWTNIKFKMGVKLIRGLQKACIKVHIE